MSLSFETQKSLEEAMSRVCAFYPDGLIASFDPNKPNPWWLMYDDLEKAIESGDNSQVFAALVVFEARATVLIQFFNAMNKSTVGG